MGGFQHAGLQVLVDLGPQDSDPKTPRPKTSDPFEDWVKGRLALESLEITQLPAAIAFVSQPPSAAVAAPAAGLANAYLLQFEKHALQQRARSRAHGARYGRARGRASRSIRRSVRGGRCWGTSARTRRVRSPRASRGAPRHCARARQLAPSLRLRLFVGRGTSARRRSHVVIDAVSPPRMRRRDGAGGRGALARAEQEATGGAEPQRQGRGAHTPSPAMGLHWLRG